MQTVPGQGVAFKEAPLMDHLEELRLRLIYGLAFWGAGSALAYTYRDQLMEVLKGPLQGFIQAGNRVEIVTLSVTEPLITALQISAFGGLVVALPFMVYQIWAFVAPGLTHEERKWGAPFVLGLGLSFALGVYFCYQVILPAALPFLLGFLGGITNLLSIGQYISQMVTYLATFGLVFELPLTIFLLTRVGLVNSQMLSSIRKYAAVTLTLLSAIITPTADPFNLALMAIPLYLLFELGIIFSRLAERGQARNQFS
ncbi:twin-arginine translocase subunit TatC [Deinococcus cellulosilyticus]|uniref:Sec-independent protein translocase protein TatC n=1 Tax=Deinococcus cellulosilyticus (strain DSM 18568 / NBRC 106333 / KACC 11606 / 5516J-15) TaxID=1223518 RepID=A0A511MZ43_DEIC1|nr:twin-arginine translocase subunit TatC [Deinococcus cellulosilyticus]GEM45812.1 Sec-independent protein translocase protein TatC [Deinococcus cellulosilyticus NBRC 106333 = KACC 11606]